MAKSYVVVLKSLEFSPDCHVGDGWLFRSCGVHSFQDIVEKISSQDYGLCRGEIDFGVGIVNLNSTIFFCKSEGFVQ